MILICLQFKKECPILLIIDGRPLEKGGFRILGLKLTAEFILNM